jgi:uncharacterized protein (TIGR03382 family)
MFRWLLLVSLIGGGCDTVGAPILAQRSLPIIDGTFEPGALAVVGIGNGPGEDGLFCTGTLVSPHVVVAAAHCLEPPLPDRVYFGSDPATGGSYVAIDEQHMYPGYDASALTGDLAVLILADAAPAEATPIALARHAPTVGQTATFIGFGCSQIGPGCGPYGRKLRVDGPITEVRSDEFEYGIATCAGDSGGPAFVTDGEGQEVLAGVTSYGDADCAQYGVDTRVDAFTAFIDDAVARADDPAGPAGDLVVSGGGCQAAPGQGGGGSLVVLGLGLALLLRRARARSASPSPSPRRARGASPRVATAQPPPPSSAPRLAPPSASPPMSPASAAGATPASIPGSGPASAIGGSEPAAPTCAISSW